MSCSFQTKRELYDMVLRHGATTWCCFLSRRAVDDSDGYVMHGCESIIVTCTGPTTATQCPFFRRVRQPVATGCGHTPKYPYLFRPVTLILGVASFLVGATACRRTLSQRGVRVKNSSSGMGLTKPAFHKLATTL